MILVQPGQNFSFNYTDFDQSATLNVAFNIYDVTSGTPIFLTKIPSTYAGFGSYVGSYSAQPGITYSVIGLVYLAGDFLVVDTSRAQAASVYKSFDGINLTSAGFIYASYDFLDSLSIQAKIYNTTGAPSLQTTVNMVSIAFGVYYGAFTGNFEESFQIIGVVYTDNTFMAPNFNYAPSSESFECLGPAPTPPTQNSALIDVTDLLHDADFVDGMSLVTRIPTINSLGENILSETTINSYGSVQPTSGKDLLRLPEALRLQDVFTFYFQGIIVATAPNEYSSVLVYKSKRYQVQRVLDWSAWGSGYTQGLCVAELPS